MAEIRAPARCVRPSRQRIESWWVVSPRPSDRHAELDVGPLPPRPVFTPRSLSLAAMALALTAPDFCISRITGSTFAAN